MVGTYVGFIVCMHAVGFLVLSSLKEPSNLPKPLHLCHHFPDTHTDTHTLIHTHTHTHTHTLKQPT